jgi:hypothetical protein
MDERAKAFFEDVAAPIDVFAEEATRALRHPAEVEEDDARAAYTTLSEALTTPEQRDAFAAAVREALNGVAHSIMVTLDGGSAYADDGAPQLLHPDGTPFPEGLHEWLFAHLAETGRL